MSQTPARKSRTADFLWSAAAMIFAGLLVWLSVQSHNTDARATEFPQGRMEIVRADGTKAVFSVEMATTPEQQQRGLMFRKSLAPDAGMLFVWPQDQPVSMWMKNTLIPLDMLFVAHDGKITKIIAHAVPHDLTPLSSDGLVRAVIEIGGGEAERQNINVGDKVLHSSFTMAP